MYQQGMKLSHDRKLVKLLWIKNLNGKKIDELYDVNSHSSLGHLRLVSKIDATAFLNDFNFF